MSCPLCYSQSTTEYGNTNKVQFLLCGRCALVFKAPEFFPSEEQEKSRYLLHQNDVNDSAYQNFVSPLVEAIILNHSSNHHGLDFGAGTGPVIAKLLQDKDYTITLYDPFFHPNDEVLKDKYDFIICCEVMEHFHKPNKEFDLLRNLLKPNGSLYCMTQLFPTQEKFKNWNYKNDPTHVVFYSEESLNWIKVHFGFKELIF
jgi:SAM-dependent methyltransferase